MPYGKLCLIRLVVIMLKSRYAGAQTVISINGAFILSTKYYSRKVVLFGQRRIFHRSFFSTEWSEEEEGIKMRRNLY